LDWGEVTDITPDLRLTLYNSGHILGSSMAHLHIGNGLHNLVYSGDMKYLRTQVLDPANTMFPRLETLIIESTYGGKADILGSRKEAEVRMIHRVNETVRRGGKILVPVLGVGRAQEVMLIIEKAMREGLLERVPIYVQGMVWDITAIHTAYPDFLNRDLRKAIFHHDENPFLSEVFKKVAGKKEQDQIIEEGGPCVILDTAGMLNAGASLEYFKRLADNPKNTILFVSYLGEGTIGRKVQNGDKTVVIGGGPQPETIHVNMEVATITDLTGHAGRNELLRFVHHLNPKPKRVIVNHGEATKCLELASSLHKINNIETNAPRNLETIRLR
ncbi:MAG: MBL fold metallo-hydrolase RNA specificity domain-containing protein, partial [Nanoarchaeota archaeon]